MVESGDADFGITSLQNVPSALDYQVLSKYRRILIAIKEHPIAKASSFSLEEIAKHPLILPTQDSNTRKIIDKEFAAKGLEYDLTMEVVGRTAIKMYVEMNLGISIINEYYVTKEDKKKLFIHDMSQLFGSAETGLVTRNGKSQSIPAASFIELLSDYSKAGS
jgi:LysR family cys regulon transcriptional activator